MLYSYNEKIYVKPFVNKMVEVNVTKDLNGGYNVVPTKNVIIDDHLDEKITSISTEKAYELTHKNIKKD